MAPREICSDDNPSPKSKSKFKSKLDLKSQSQSSPKLSASNANSEKDPTTEIDDLVLSISEFDVFGAETYKRGVDWYSSWVDEEVRVWSNKRPTAERGTRKK